MTIENAIATRSEYILLNSEIRTLTDTSLDDSFFDRTDALNPNRYFQEKSAETALSSVPIA